MEKATLTDELWEAVRRLLLPYEGLASQLYVLDLPASALGDCLEIFCDVVDNPTVHCLDGYSFPEDERPEWSSDRKREVLSTTGKDSLNVIGGELSGLRQVMLWIWDVRKRGTFDAELVFWADQFFPDPSSNKACHSAFAEIATIAERIRAIHPGSECAMSASESGDPRDDRDEDWTFLW
jgi:hypothetical protein